MSEPDGLSILVRARNHRAFLPESLRNALDALTPLEESGFPTEVLVLDDASQDGSQKLLRSVQALYDEPRLRSLCLAENLGPAGLRDLGIREATFRYVCVTDADNEVVPENLPLLLRSIVDTGAAMAYGNLVDLEDGAVAGIRSNMPVVPALAKSRHLGNLFILDRKKALPSETGPNGPEGLEGWHFGLAALSGGERVVFVPIVAGYRRTRSMSAGRKLLPSGDGAAPRPAVLSGTMPAALAAARTYHPEVGFLDQ